MLILNGEWLIHGVSIFDSIKNEIFHKSNCHFGTECSLSKIFAMTKNLIFCRNSIFYMGRGGVEVQITNTRLTLLSDWAGFVWEKGSTQPPSEKKLAIFRSNRFFRGTLQIVSKTEWDFVVNFFQYRSVGNSVRKFVGMIGFLWNCNLMALLLYWTVANFDFIRWRLVKNSRSINIDSSLRMHWKFRFRCNWAIEIKELPLVYYQCTHDCS